MKTITKQYDVKLRGKLEMERKSKMSYKSYKLSKWCKKEEKWQQIPVEETGNLFRDLLLKGSQEQMTYQLSSM